jgi:hypothetical protein
MPQRIEFRTKVFPQSLLGRILGMLAAATLLVAAFFFLFFVLLAVGVAVLGFSLRAWWRTRNARDAASAEVIEGEYTVEVPVLPWQVSLVI